MLGAMSAGIEISASFNPLQWGFFFRSPRVSVNGQEFPLIWGRRVASFPPGQYAVQIWVPSLFGRSAATQAQVSVYEGQVTGLLYEIPFLWLLTGATLKVRGTKPFGA